MCPVIEVSGLSITGPVREDNQDSIHLYQDEDPYPHGQLFGLADGMGGYSHGKMASDMALNILFNTYHENPAQSTKALRKGVETANLGVYQAAQRLQVGRMGTTLTALAFNQKTFNLVHVGDSRAYLIRNGKITCLTNDHTLVGDLVRMKVLTSDQVRTHAQRSVLTKALGISLFVQPDIKEHGLLENDRLVVCSDGIWSVMEDEEMSHLVTRTGSMHELSQALIETGLDKESDDNMSVIAMHIHQLGKPIAESVTKSRRNFFPFSWITSRR